MLSDSVVQYIYNNNNNNNNNNNINTFFPYCCYSAIFRGNFIKIFLNIVQCSQTLKEKYQRIYFSLCTSQTEASTSPPPTGQPPGHLNFWKIFVQIPPSPGRKAVQMPPPDYCFNFSVASIMLDLKLCM